MTQSENIHRQEVRLTFSPDISGDPLVCHLVSKYDLMFNILQAQISSRKEGTLTLELIGPQEKLSQGVEYLKNCGVKVRGIMHKVAKDDQLCMNCGMCTALCSVNALFVDSQTRHVHFNEEICTACGLCTRICPVNAMHAEMSQVML